MWSRRARPDRGDAPNVGMRFRAARRRGARDFGGLVEPRLAAGRWPECRAVLARRSRPLRVEVAGAPAQQLTLPVPAVAGPPSASAGAQPDRGAATAVGAVPLQRVGVRRRRSTGTRARGAGDSTRARDRASHPVALAPSAPLDDPAPATESRALRWIALAAAAVVVALLAWFLVGDRAGRRLRATSLGASGARTPTLLRRPRSPRWPTSRSRARARPETPRRKKRW